MGIFDGLIHGFQVALTGPNLLYCLIGATLGTVIGILPGLGPVATISLLLPVTFGLEPSSAIIMLAGIFYGAMYGGSTTSILVNLPGESASVVTTLDGYQMAKQGRAGAALGVAAIGSFFAGTIAVLGLTFLAPLLSKLAIRFGPPEYTTLMILGLMLVVYLTSKSPLKGVIMAGLGLLLATVGMDPITGVPRLTFGSLDLFDGFDFAPVAMGVFGIGEILTNVESSEEATLLTAELKNLWPTIKDLAESKWAILRGSILGFFIGIIPGGGAVISSLVSYSVEKSVSKEPETFGKGNICGVAGPESANNAAATSSFIPLLTLGVPANATMAIIFGALLIHGITPGPYLIADHPDVFWGVIASMYIGNVFLLIENLPMVGFFVQLLKIPFRILAPFVVLITLIGAYSINYSTFDMILVVAFGVLGYLLNKTGFEPGPLLLALVIGPLLESNVRRSLLISGGNPGIFVRSPLSTVFLVLALLIPVVQIVRALTNKKDISLEQQLEEKLAGK
jgi:putative tricarboxylic transport membrane protein